MKKICFLLMACAIVITSCNNKLTVGAPYKEVTVVYGLLSMADTAHYVKITKGYYDETLNNLSLAKNADSLYFNNLLVEVEIKNNGTVIQTIVLDRVDLNNEGYVKEPGTFATSPNYAYKFKKNLDPQRSYKLRIKNLTSGKEVYGETRIISSLPSAFRFIKPFDFAEELSFTDPIYPYRFSWTGPSTAAFYDISILFRYQEVDLTSPNDTTYVEKDIPLIKNVLASQGSMNADLTNVAFYQQLNSFISSSNSNIRRFLDTPGLVISAGDHELRTFIEVGSAQGGITADQIKPNYTNLKGDFVFGLFSSRGRIQIPNIRFSGNTIDSIRNSTYTNKLKFIGISSK